MPGAVSKSHLRRFTDIILQLLRLRPRLKSVLPRDQETLHRLAQLMNTHPEGLEASLADFDNLFSLGIICAQSPGPVSMGELSQALNVPFSTATRMVDWLVKNGYVERQPDAEDRRVVRVALTPAGQAMVQAGNELMQMRAEFLLRQFTPAERESLVALLAKLLQALESNL